MATNNFRPVIKIIDQSQKIGLITHISGDGDAFGSVLALRNSLEKLGKKVIIFSNEDIPDNLNYLKKSTRYSPKKEYEKIDLLIATDANSKKRLTLEDVFDKVKNEKIPTVLIDHHEIGSGKDEFDFVISNSKVSSASEIVYCLIKEMGIKIDKKIAEYLLVGIDTDTNYLENPNTYQSTLKARKELIKLGVDVEKIHKELKKKNILKNKKFMEEIEKRIIKKDGVITAYVLDKDYEKFNIDVGVSSPLSTYLDQKYNAKIVLVAEQRDENFVKVSLRSNKSGLDVSKLASFFGGGGHKQAAGFEYEGKIEDLL